MAGPASHLDPEPGLGKLTLLHLMAAREDTLRWQRDEAGGLHKAWFDHMPALWVPVTTVQACWTLGLIAPDGDEQETAPSAFLWLMKLTPAGQAKIDPAYRMILRRRRAAELLLFRRPEKPRSEVSQDEIEQIAPLLTDAEVEAALAV